MRILFVTWDGPQVSYLEGLFLPIFVGLKGSGVHVDVLQFTWGDRSAAEQSREACERAGVGYRSVGVLRKGGGAGPFLSALTGARHVRSAVRSFASDVIMPRSMIAAIPVLRAGGAKLRPILFDSDGLAVDERVDFAGLSPRSVDYRILRDVEAQTVQQAASILVRSERATEILCARAGPPVTPSRFHVVTNGRDDAIFHPFDESSRQEVRRALGMGPEVPLLVYAGSVGAQYRFDLVRSLSEEMLRLRVDTRLLVLSGSPEVARAELGSFASIATVLRVAPAEVPRYLAAGDAGIAYRAESFSMQAVSPIKVSEYTLCGVPIVGTASIGNTRAAVEAGVFLDQDPGPAAAASWIVGDVLPRRADYRQRARNVGVENFSLRRSVEDYLRAIKAMPVQAAAGWQEQNH